MLAAQAPDIADIPRLLRAGLREALPSGASLRRAKQGWLFASDAPLRLKRASEEAALRSPSEARPAAADPSALVRAAAKAGLDAGFLREMLLLRPSAAWISAFEAARPDPPDFFSASMARFRGAALRPGAAELFADGLRLIESSDANERRGFLVRARQFAAVSLRAGGGGGYAVALLAARLREADAPAILPDIH